MKLRGAAIAAILVTAGLAQPAAAQSQEIAISTRGAPAAVHRAIVDGAWRYCREDLAGKYRDRGALSACVKTVVDDAVARSGRSDLSTYHFGLGARARYQTPS